MQYLKLQKSDGTVCYVQLDNESPVVLTPDGKRTPISSLTKENMREFTTTSYSILASLRNILFMKGSTVSVVGDW